MSATGHEPDGVTHPAHYNAHSSGIECIEIVEALSFNLGNAIKYLWRADEKGAPSADLGKALFYLRREQRFASGFHSETYRRSIYDQAVFYQLHVRSLLLRVSERSAEPLATVTDALAALLGGGIKPAEFFTRAIAAVEADAARRAG